MNGVNEDAAYVCPSCGEEIVIPIDVTEGSSQRYVEDCPVCCCPNVISVEFDSAGRPVVEAEAE
jgi:hypothetical protein